jgi:hypothetical protein
MIKAFTAAGWVQVDKTVGGALLNVVVGTIEKTDYVTIR